MTLLSELRPKVTATKVVLQSAWAKHYAHAWTAGLIGLVLATSWAVASVSWWLVPPYLLVMAFVLFAPGEPSNDDATPSILVGPHSAIEPLADAPSASEEESVSNASTAALPAGVPAPTRKSKGRKKQSAKTQPEPPPEATWIQVGPGKFVRVEGSALVSDQIAQPETLITPTADSEDQLAEPSTETQIEIAPSDQSNEWEDDEPNSPEPEALIETEPVPEEITEASDFDEPEALQDEVEAEIEEFEDHGIAPDASEDFEDQGIEPEDFNDFENHGIAPEVSEEFEDEGTEPEDFEELEDHGIAPEASEEASEIEAQAEPDEFEDVSIATEEIEDDSEYEFDETEAETGEKEFEQSEPRPLGTINVWMPTGKFVLRRNLRSSRKVLQPAGYRCRSERGHGRKRRAGSRSHIRSPPGLNRSS